MGNARRNATAFQSLVNQKRAKEIYRPNQDVEILQSPATLSGEDVLPGFVLDLEPIMSMD